MAAERELNGNGGDEDGAPALHPSISEDVASDEWPAQPWEARDFRVRVPDDLRFDLGGFSGLVLFPRNTLDHLRNDHPEDAGVLSALQELFESIEWIEDRIDAKIILYSRHGGIWRRIVVATEKEYAVAVSIYRRDRVKTERAIVSGKYRKRGG